MNQHVNLTKRVMTAHGWRYCPVVLAANGRVKPDAVIINGKQDRHTEGSYYIEWREGSKRKRLAVGKDAADATARRMRKEAELNALNNGVSVVPQSGKRSIGDLITEYLSEIRVTRTPATHSAYSLALRNFTDSCTKAYIEEIERADLLAFITHLRDEELSDRTCHNRFEHLLTFLKAYGVTKLATKRDWPKYVQQEPESYEDEELEKFFAACDDYERVFFEFYLMTGFRKKEVTYTCWSDIDLKRLILQLRPSPRTRPWRMRRQGRASAMNWVATDRQFQAEGH